jgi:hypothetical protein
MPKGERYLLAAVGSAQHRDQRRQISAQIIVAARGESAALTAIVIDRSR